MERAKRFFKSVRTIEGTIIGEDIENIPVNFPSQHILKAEQGSIYFPSNNAYYIVETENGTERFPKDGTDLKINEHVKVIETSYCGGLIKTKWLSRN